MHRHGYKGRKFNRERDQRRALMKGLAESLVRDESIETTLPKAKDLVPYIEKLITKAKRGDLHNRRQVIENLQTVGIAHKLVDEIAPKLTARQSGHVRVVRTSLRRGDNAQLARISFVDDLSAKSASGDKPAPVPAKAESKKPVAKPATATKPPIKKKPIAKKKDA